MDIRIGWAEFDATAPPMQVNIGWCEFDVASTSTVCIGWAEFDCRSPTTDPVPPFYPGGGVSRYHSSQYERYDVPLLDVLEEEEEEIVLALLMEIAEHEL